MFYLQNKSHVLADNVLDLGESHSKFKTGNYPHSMFIQPTIPEEVIKTAKSLKPKTSTRHDNLSTKLLRSIIDEVATPFAHTCIINCSFKTGVVPQQSKIAKVIQIHKNGDKQL